MIFLGKFTSIVEPEWLVQNGTRPLVRIIDMRSEKAYAAGHLEGAVYVPDAPLRNPEERSTYLPHPDVFAQMMSQAGISRDTHIVVYDDAGGKFAARLWYILQAYGHDKVSFLNGGWQKWNAQNLPVTTAIPTVTPTRFTPSRKIQLSCPLPNLLGRKSSTLVLDARSPSEYAATEISPGAKVAGRIPGAVNVEWKENITGPYLEFKSDDDLRLLYKNKGITPEKEIIIHCASGARAAHTLFVLKRLGYKKVTVYYGSFSDYTNLNNVPIENSLLSEVAPPPQ
jgi:thiosulfate/3-mercaptopyruvate sulfurtransferase